MKKTEYKKSRETVPLRAGYIVGGTYGTNLPAHHLFYVSVPNVHRYILHLSPKFMLFHTVSEYSGFVRGVSIVFHTNPSFPIN